MITALLACVGALNLLWLLAVLRVTSGSRSRPAALLLALPIIVVQAWWLASWRADGSSALPPPPLWLDFANIIWTAVILPLTLVACAIAGIVGLRRRASS